MISAISCKGTQTVAVYFAAGHTGHNPQSRKSGHCGTESSCMQSTIICMRSAMLPKKQQRARERGRMVAHGTGLPYQKADIVGKKISEQMGGGNLSRCAFGDLVLAIPIFPAGIRFTNNFQVIDIIAASSQGDLREQFYQVFLGCRPSV